MSKLKSSLTSTAFVLLTLALGTMLRAQSTVGTWQGTATYDKDQSRLVVKITENGGQLSGALYAIDEDDGGDPTSFSSISRQGDTLKFAVAIAGLAFSGRFSPDGNSITGTFTADKISAPLTLVRATADTAWDIPKPIVLMARGADPSFEVATIKPSKAEEAEPGISLDGRNFSTIATTLDQLIGYAFDVHRTQIVGVPAWAGDSKFDVAGVPDLPGQPSDSQTKSMMRKLLLDRFQLKFHTEKRVMAVYVISVAKGGPKNMTKNTGPDNGFSIPLGGTHGGLKISVYNGTVTNLAIFGLNGVMDHPVLDRTGLTDRYDFSLSWLPDMSQFEGKVQLPAYKNPQPDIFTAMPQQLGLNFKAARAEVDVMVIDHVELPSAN